MPASDDLPFTCVGKNNRAARLTPNQKSPSGDQRNSRKVLFRQEITFSILALQPTPTRFKQRFRNWRKREGQRVDLARADTDLRAAELDRKNRLDAQRATAKAARDAATTEDLPAAAREDSARRRPHSFHTGDCHCRSLVGSRPELLHKRISARP